MKFDQQGLLAVGSTAAFVVLWSSGGIFSKVALAHASPLAFLLLRFVVALLVLLAFAWARRRAILPPHGTRILVACTGLLLIGVYSTCYLFALDRGITPGVLAGVLGAQPILTLLVMERRFSWRRLAGLLLALGGLVLVVFDSIVTARFSVVGIAFALAALASVTSGAVLQKRIAAPPLQVLPLQYAITIALCLALMPQQGFVVRFSPWIWISLLWLGLVISVIAQLLLYRLIHAGNLVNVTSLFYLVPGMTAAMDYAFLGNRLSADALLGMIAIVAGLFAVFSTSAAPER